MTTVALLDYGSGNLRSAERAVASTGATTVVTHDPDTVLNADGLLVPGVGAFAACMDQLNAVGGPRLIGSRLAGGRPVFGICVGMQVLFDRGVEYAEGIHAPEAHDGAQPQPLGTPGCGEWPGTVERLEANVLPHMGWNTVDVAEGSKLFDGLAADERYYFVHSYAARQWHLNDTGRIAAPLVHWAEHDGCRFIAAVENGPLWATQFHPEKSGEAGLRLLRNWVSTLD
ncbi:imidazole glycerol phosphate synthase subunit HisH [Corynebacterium sp. TAE3-ERU12]|uniref:imidazole glycerol phosphate synthase subunit HisH n=1 Tax=Corynebacterium sp. TAE3-ERU12 TaxID=2849491 RepID=UPI001C45F4CB|nr:imidazole glycerol phosphate synthase subunit HisH [Corynebacterium sp. TAE3-ERU12]MBV7296173.1 imidazole glycerol phosphate synthase subunit HisH [Corynebacterium sp. TAE3-ERU12]